MAEVMVTGAACSPPPTAHRTPRGRGNHRHAVLLDQQLEEVDGRLVGAGDRLVRPSFFSSVEKYGENRNTCSSRDVVEGVGELAELLADLVELVLLLGHLEEGAGVDRGDLLHGASAAPRRRAR